jgi:hypothetical protein
MAFAFFEVYPDERALRVRLRRLSGPRDSCGVVAYFDDKVLHDDTGKLAAGVEAAQIPAEWAQWPGGNLPQNLNVFFIKYPAYFFLSWDTPLPATKTAAIGADVTFTAVPKGGTAPYTYAWYFGSILIDPKINPTASTPALINHAVAANSSGKYKCVVSDSGGQTIETTTTLTVS